MKLSIHNNDKTVEVSDSAFDAEYNETLIHQLVVSFMAAGRAGTKAQKTRSEVSGGGAKPWRQKGTGRARAGTIRSPIWRSGGVTFAAKPRDFTKKLNKKMYTVGMRSIVSELVRSERLKVVDSLVAKEVKTKAFVATMNDIGVDSGLFITDGLDSNLYLSARNVPNTFVIDVAAVDPVSLVRFNNVVIDESALVKLNERLA
ncbi:MAG: 50S ribosomal protein L4 [Gammaproteobacteria bacterium]|nr:50S ribosomal protein L4 [Gammaproteobacteria bacterium]